MIAAAGRQQPLRSLYESVHVRQEKRMSFVTTQPQALAAAAPHLARDRFVDRRPKRGCGGRNDEGGSRGHRRGIGADRGAVRHAQIYLAVSAQAAARHETFVNTSGTSAGSHTAAEAANATAAG
jgi:hypothetical protein